jgi:N-methylhydantoinase B
MEEYRLSDLEGLSAYILETSDRSMLEAIGKLPKGSWKHSMRIDGFDAPLDLVATLTIEKDIIRVDYTGTSKLSKFGINCPMCYTDAYTSFGVKCLVAPRLANNAAVLSRIVVTAPDNCITNALFPAPVTARALIGHMLPDLVFGCFDQAIPAKVPAEGTGSSWTLRLAAGPGITGIPAAQSTPFMAQTFQSGGMGGHPNLDGLSATPFPSGVKSIATEITEALTPLVIWKKELRRDSGGAGLHRGGLGQVMEIGSREPAPFAIFARFQRVEYPARGRRGGLDGAAGAVRLKSGAPMKSRGTQAIPADDRLIVEMPGGGGLGDPAARDPESVARDVADGFVSEECARELYKVVFGNGHTVDIEATRRLRRSGTRESNL